MPLASHPALRAGRVLTLLSLTGLCAAPLAPALADLPITVLASFTGTAPGTNGGHPNAVTFDTNGNLFGTTESGGASGAGVVYEIAKNSNVITDLASFTGPGAGTNGGYAEAGVTFDSNGNLFGTAYEGGASGVGTVYEIAKGTTTITDLASFNGNGAGTNGGNPSAGVTFDSHGNLFGTTTSGGAFDYGVVYEIAKNSNVITDLASFNGIGPGTNGGHPIAGVTFDSNGNLFGTAVNGGASGAGAVYEIAKGSHAITDLASFTRTNGGDPNAGVIFDSNGNLFGTTYGGGNSNAGVVYEIAGAGSPVPESSTVISFATLLGLGGLLLRARKCRQNATPGA